MADEDVVISEKCSCGNDDPSKFWIIKDPENEDELWGLCCKRKNCRKEYLTERFADEEMEGVMIANGVLLFENEPTACQLDPDFQVRLSRARVTSLDHVIPGDHVGFDRWYLIWHHAIVVEVHDTYMVIEGWDGVITTKRVRVNVTKEELSYGHTHKFEYPDAIRKKNPRELVIARSNSRQHPDGDDAGLPLPWCSDEYDERYGFFNANCEHYSTYCMTGVSMCNQTAWLGRTLKEALSVSVEKTLKSVIGGVTMEILENMAEELTAAVAAHASVFKMVGLLGIVMAESAAFCEGLKPLKERYHKIEITKEQYEEELGKKVIELSLVIAVAGGGGIIVEACFSPLAEILICPVLIIGAKLGARFLTHFMSEESLKWYTKKWELLEDTLSNIKERIMDVKDAVVVATQKAVNFVKEEVLPRIESVIEAIKEFLAWLIC